LTTTELHQLLDALFVYQGTRKEKARGIRNQTLALVMSETGLRVNELVQLRVGDLHCFDAPASNLIVRPEIAKNGKERHVPISTKLANAIVTMNELIWSRDNVTIDNFAFYMNDPEVPLTTRQIERIIKRGAKHARLGRVYPHMLRHTFATRVLAKTNTRAVQLLLGHSSLQSTQIYTHPTTNDLKTAIDSME